MTWLIAGLLLVQKPVLVANNDAKVVNVAMASFYEKAKWNSEWTDGKFVVLGPQFWDKKRPVFSKLLAGMIDRERQDPSAKKVVALLEGVRRESERRKGAVVNVIGPFLPLMSLELDPRIIVSTVKVLRSLDIIAERSRAEREGRKYVPQVWTNRLGETGSVRVNGRPLAPCYSADGRYAILHLDWFLWSGWHSAELTFLLENVGKGWAVLHVGRIYYV